MHMLGVPRRSANFNRSLNTCPKNDFFTIETVRITNKINEPFLEASFKLFSVRKLKNKNNYLYLKKLILSGDINLNPGPADRHQIKEHKFKVFTRKGLYFIHLNINSLLPKINELQYIAKNSNAAVIGMSETKLDNTVYDSEVAIDGYNIARSDRNTKCGGVACYIRSNICFNLKTCLSKNIENIFIDLLFPKTKPITVGVIYKPQDQTRSLEQIITEFETLDLNDEHYVLGNFNISLLFKGKYFFDKPDKFMQFYKEFSPEIKNYTEFCSKYGFKELIKGSTRTTRITSTLIDHILQSGIIDTAVSDHSMVYCTGKISREKYNKQKEIIFRSLKNYSVDVYKEALDKVSISNYDNFDNPEIAYSDFISKLESVINVLAPIKTVRIKNNTREWFDEEIGEEIYKRDKLHKKFKWTKLHVDADLYKEARNAVQNLIRKKKKAYFEGKLKANTANPRKLWETLKELGLLNNRSLSSNICLKKKDGVTFDPFAISEVFQKFYSNLAGNLVDKLWANVNKFGLHTVEVYYENVLQLQENKFIFHTIESSSVVKLLKNVEVNKAAGIDNISG